MDESLLLLQYVFTGETLDSSLTRESRLKDQYFDSEGRSSRSPDKMLNHIFYAGSFVKGSARPYPRRSLSELFAQHIDLSPIQAEAAAGFIWDCLQLNPFDQLYMHRWLETALTGC